MIPHVYLAPKLQCSREYKNAWLTNSQKYLGTFQMFIHATKKVLVRTTSSLLRVIVQKFMHVATVHDMGRFLIKFL